MNEKENVKRKKNILEVKWEREQKRNIDKRTKK